MLRRAHGSGDDDHDQMKAPARQSKSTAVLRELCNDVLDVAGAEVVAGCDVDGCCAWAICSAGGDPTGLASGLIPGEAAASGVGA